MNQDWKLIQTWAGVAADGIPGPATARGIIAKAGLKPVETAPATGLKPSLVRGTGKGIQRIFIHCTATREGQDIDAATIRGWHRRQGWHDIGYHFVIRLDGTIERGRPEDQVGSHVAGWNTGSIALVYAGGLDSQGKPKDTRTPAQLRAMAQLCRDLLAAYPGVRLMGHRDVWSTPDKWLKDCPCFDVAQWWEGARP